MKLDHLVYGVPELQAGIDHMEALLGVRAQPGGQHPTFGTHNALIHLGPGTYLEIIAIDPTNTVVAPPRWMGLDLLTRPRLTRWAVKASPLAPHLPHLAEYQPAMARVLPGQRHKPDGTRLVWELTPPLPAPEVELVPFLIDWSQSDQHPADSLPDVGCRLDQLKATHPLPSTVARNLTALPVALDILPGPAANLEACIQCPKGKVWI